MNSKNKKKSKKLIKKNKLFEPKKETDLIKESKDIADKMLGEVNNLK